ncbi:MAG: EF-P beta-lysylation protein EpmB [Thermoguttaceae bacterium]|jgi:EF-P beta-lysylation protein EpmB|nr:EF-P beta-lysylation protein EpmB [Thermoguttaceae bacterium]
MAGLVSNVERLRPMPPDYPDWQAALADPVTDPAELCQLLGLTAELGEHTTQAGSFPLLVPRTFVARMRPGDPSDPLLLQVLPQKDEERSHPLFTPDPLGELQALGAPGTLWKYQGRLLILAAGQCAVHCRFCFRRHFPYDRTGDWPARWEQSLCQVANEPSLHEVILSGGDPLTLADAELHELLGRVSRIPHVARVRIHTRLPIMVPARVTGELVAALRGTRLTPVVVVHVNHAAEIDASVAEALGRLIDAGIPVLSQSVLLRRINDSAEALAALFERLVNVRVIPYYLHQLDRVAGAAHFEVPVAQGIELMRQLRLRLPGYAIPRYVRETPLGACKEVLA